MDSTLFWTVIGIAVATLGLIYTMIRNLNTDLDKRMDLLNAKIDALGGKVETIDTRLVEVEKHLFAMRTIFNYDPDILRKEK